MSIRFSYALTLAVALSSLAPLRVGAQEGGPFDLVILGGRVVDPESGFDGLANVGIRGDRVVAVGTALYDQMGQRGAVLNYGTNVGHGALRVAVGLSSGDEEGRAVSASQEQVEQIVELARRGIMDGALGIGFGLQYVPSTSEGEVFRLFELGARHGVPSHLHVRYLGPLRPVNSVKAIHEVIATAAATGASAHVVHVNSTSPKDIDLVLALLEGAAANGVDVSSDVYPWEAGSTGLESSVFDEGFRERMSIDYSDIELVSTGERLTEETFHRYRQDENRDGVIVYFITTETLRKALTSPIVMVGSDGSPTPRAGGTLEVPAPTRASSVSTSGSGVTSRCSRR